mmetsp:Transcript_6804/g.15803  ORF Transcript_6804/g.15803 Transcript_6804/m.15803 type:complete len:204 (+) Transcript_6804:650-1261(+)
MFFIDFESIAEASNAMVRFQGYRFAHEKGAEHAERGLVIDYDKDLGQAETQKEKRDRIVAGHFENSRSADYFCCECGSKAFRTKAVLLCELPVRSTDGAAVLDEATQLKDLLLLASEKPVSIRRPKGIERQNQLLCRSCGACVAYRAATTSSASYLYVHQSSISLKFVPGAAPSPGAKRRAVAASMEMPSAAAPTEAQSRPTT